MSKNLIKKEIRIIILCMSVFYSVMIGILFGCMPMNEELVTKKQAVEKAKQMGQKEYGNIDMFNVTVEEDSIYWMVNFAKPHALEDGESQHFAVWINKEKGEARLFKGR